MHKSSRCAHWQYTQYANQVNEVSRASFAKLSNMYKIKKCITEDGAKTMVLTMITSGLDYCNSLYYGLPDYHIKKLYCVQKSAARLMTLTGKYEHITPAFIALHWLPIKERCDFKVLLLTYKCFSGLAPAYFEELLHQRPDLGSHRNNDNLLIVPKVNRVTFGGLHLREQPLTSGIVYLPLYVRAKLWTFLNLG